LKLIFIRTRMNMLWECFCRCLLWYRMGSKSSRHTSNPPHYRDDGVTRKWTSLASWRASHQPSLANGWCGWDSDIPTADPLYAGHASGRAIAAYPNSAAHSQRQTTSKNVADSGDSVTSWSHPGTKTDVTTAWPNRISTDGNRTWLQRPIRAHSPRIQARCWPATHALGKEYQRFQSCKD
jgi:hypothetical protein